MFVVWLFGGLAAIVIGVVLVERWPRATAAILGSAGAGFGAYVDRARSFLAGQMPEESVVLFMTGIGLAVWGVLYAVGWLFRFLLSDDQETKRGDSDAEANLTTAAQIAGAAAGGAAGGPIGAAAGMALAQLTGDMLKDRAQQVARRRMSRLQQELARLAWENPDMAALVVSNDPEQSEILFRIYRSIMDARDERAIGPITRLTGAYINRKRDVFFHAVGKLFEELIGTDFDTLEQLLDACLQVPEDVQWILATATDSTVEPKNVKIEWTTRAQGQSEPERFSKHVDVAGGEFVPVVVALKRHGIANESVAGVAGAKSGPGIMVVQREVARRIRGLLGLEQTH